MPDQADELRKIMAKKRAQEAHTPELWGSLDGKIISESGELVTDCGWYPRGKADARRIVACVNSLKGIQTEYLESHGLDDVGETVQSLDTAIRERDEARAMVAELMSSIKNAHYNHAMHPLHVDVMDAGPDAEWPTKLMHANCKTCALIAKAQALLA